MSLFPAPSTLPAPGGFPALTPAPAFGLTTAERSMASEMGNPTALLGVPTTTQPAAPASAVGGRTASATPWLDLITGGALGTGNDPATWTAETAAAQSDAALAKIAQVNPELAQSIAAQHGKSEGEDLPWYKDILKGVGEFTHATKLDVVFDLMGRASHIVPEVIHDWGKQTVWENMSDAMLGKSDTNWADVLVDNLGMERNAFTAAIGFIGDIATDPMTWLTWGAGAMGREAIARASSEALIESVLTKGTVKVSERTAASLAEKGVKVAVGDVVETGQLFKAVGEQIGAEGADATNKIARAIFGLRSPGQELAERGSTGLLSRVRRALTGIHPEAAPSVAFVLDQEGTRVAAAEVLRLADDVFRESTTIGWARVTEETAAKLGVDKAAVDTVLKSYVKAGTGFGVDKAAYTYGKEAAGALGGVRLRMSNPLLDIRVAGQRLPFAAARMDFSMGRRFFAGLSGGVKLSRLVGEGAATVEDLHIFWEKGFSGLKTLSNSAAAKQMAKGPQSIFYSASEQVGKATAHLSAHAAVLRGGGLPAVFARDANLQLMHMRQQVIDEVQTVTLADGNTVLTPDQTIARVVQASKTAGKGTGGVAAQVELTDALNEYRSLVPQPGTKATDYYDVLIADAKLQAKSRGEDASEAVAELERMKVTAQRVEGRIKELGQDDNLADMWRTMAHQHDQALINSGIAPDHVHLGADGETLADRTHVRVEDAKAHSFDGQEYETPMVTVSQGPNDVEALTDLVDLGDGTKLPLRGLAARQVGPIGEQAAEASVKYGPVAEAEKLAAAHPSIPMPPPPPPEVVIGPVVTSGPLAAPSRFYRGHVPGVVKDDGTLFWHQSVFGSHSREVGERYSKLPGGELQAYDIQPGAKVLVQDTPEYNAVVERARQLDLRPKDAKGLKDINKGGSLDRLWTQAKDEGWDVIQMRDDDLGTAVLNPKVLKRVEDVVVIPKAWEPPKGPFLTGGNPEGGTYLSMGNRDWEAAGAPKGTNQRMRDISEMNGIESATVKDEVAKLEEKYGAPPYEDARTYHYGDEVPGTPAPLTDKTPPVAEGKVRVYRAGNTARDAGRKGTWWTDDLQEAKNYVEAARKDDPRELVYMDVDPNQLPTPRGAGGTKTGETVSPRAAKVSRKEELLARADEAMAGPGPEADLAAGVEAQVVTITGAEAAYVAQPRLAGLGPQNLLDVDYSPVVAGAGREASAVVNRIEEIQSTYGPVLDQIAAGTYQFGEDVSPEAAAAVQEVMARGGAKEQQLADITTEILKSDGYTGVRIKGADGKVTVVGFYDEKTGTTMFSRVNPRAQALSPNRGSQLRAVTDGAKEAVLGTNRAEGTDLIQSILREARDMPRPQAEALAKDRLAAKGITLREGQSFFETDPVAVLKETSTQVSNKVVAQAAGETLRMAESLGLSRGGFGQSAAGFGAYRVVISSESIEAVATMSEEVKMAATRASNLTDSKAIPNLRLKVEKLTSDFNEASDAYKTLVENARAREVGIINNMRRTVDEQGGQLDPDLDKTLGNREIRVRNMAQHQADFNEAFDGVGAPLAQLSEKVFKRVHADGTAVYYYVEDGKVLGARKVDSIGEYLSDFQRVQASKGDRYLELARTVHAMTGPDVNSAARVAAGQEGVGDALRNAHWDDVGVNSFDDLEAVIGQQTFSGAGLKLNERGVKEWSNRFKRTAQKRANAVKQEAEMARRELQHREVELTEAVSEAKRLEARAQMQRAPVMAALVPAEDAANRTGMAVLRVPGFEKMAMPEVMANEFEMAMKGFPKLDGAHAAWRQFNGWWKSMATWLMPGFHLRNFQGAFFNNWLGGVGLRDYVTAGRIRMAERELTHGKPAKWATMRIIEKDPEFVAGLRRGIPGGNLMGKKVEDLTYADLASLGAGLNTTASNGRMFAEAALTVEKAEKKYAGKSGTMGALPQYAKVMRGAGTMTENVFRTAALVRGMRDGRSIMEARAFTMVRHGDYEDLTDWEYGWVRDLIPFYKWMRTNTPFQIHQLLENPAKLLAMQKAQMSVFDARGLEFDKEKYRAPEWMMQSFVIPGKVDKDGTYDTVMLDLPMSDLFTSGREFVSSFLPTVRPFLESYVLHQSIYTGAPIEGKQVKMNPAFGIIEPLLDAVGLTSRGPDGQAYMSDKTQNLLGTIPIYSRFKNFITEDPARVKNRQHALTSALLGLGGYKVDEATLTSNELDFYYSTIVPTMDYLKQMGYPLPTKDDLTSTLGSIDGILLGLGITPGPPAQATAA